MSGLSRILIYAELLSNIRQVSVGCSLPSTCSSGTEASVSLDGQQLTIKHEGEECSIQLPGAVNVPQKLPIQNRSSRTLSWRLPLASAAPNRAGVASSQLDAQTVPWSATDLEPGCDVVCRTCQVTIVGRGTINVWKDLPSENWAEMMEFWHCHKPDDHDGHGHDHPTATADGQHLAGRGYGANSRISGQAGTGFVDLTSFLFFENDCTNLTIPATDTASQQMTMPGKHGNPVLCKSCSTEIGVSHKETASVTVYKWHLSMSTHTSESLKLRSRPTLANCIASILASTLSRSGCSKSIIVPIHTGVDSHASPEAQLLHVWLFNGNISFTSSSLGYEHPVFAVKILYRFVSKEEADRMNESMTSDVQDIALPISAVDGLKQLLATSNGWLPDSDRSFREWTVGLLEKWAG